MNDCRGYRKLSACNECGASTGAPCGNCGSTSISEAPCPSCELDALSADGFTHTITLTCGCKQRLNFPGEVYAAVGHWQSCDRHSKIVDDYERFDPHTGEPILARDQRVVAVTKEDSL